MRALYSLDDAADLTSSCVTIGNFDGVHRGHQALIERVVERARRDEHAAVALTFEPHPVRYFRGPGHAPFLLTTLDQKLDALAELGLDAALVLPFDRATAAMSPEDFVRRILIDHLAARYVLVGYDFGFGKGRTGTLDDLRRIGAEATDGHFEAEAFGPVLDGELPLSSSRVRHAIADGDMAEATRLMGRPFAVRGEVVGGDARGREIGFPTANIDQRPEQLRPEHGIYVTTLRVDGQPLPSVSSIGVRPTYYDADANPPRTTEAYVLDAPGDLDLYGKDVELLLHERLRPELAFESTGALVAQIERDVADARRWHGLDQGT